MTLELDRETVQRIVQNLDPSFIAGGFSRLHGGSTEVYRIDLAGANREPLVLKIYPDEPEWGPAKERLVAGWCAELTALVPKWLEIDESRSLLPLRYALLPLLPGRSLRDWMAEPDIENAYRQMGELLRRIHAMPMATYSARGAIFEDTRLFSLSFLKQALSSPLPLPTLKTRFLRFDSCG
ncbi:aminoglycoside phosphotransferase family protein [Rhizobium sp. 1399]|uniref:phosphotransferase family protein n=1 Tax=Rhizobium sp. 1399 TaxID=2817758 RepID=UPI00285B8CF9|nr:aminoglycoside phosphotransferase family protein [Rhizobium sp. 1399]MDR6666393.1 Ser/Thr protein kinase RdoA (MazF antagonist) [Rhizobium sp. 1399]